MKRQLTLVTAAALCLSAMPALAQNYKRDHRDDRAQVWRPAPRAKVTGYAPLRGPAGTIVTIDGENFAYGTKVVYDGAVLTPRRVTPTSIAFEIPSSAKDGKIALRVPGARRELQVGSFDVRAPRRAHWDRVFLSRPEVKAELSLHASRVARLQRMRKLAAANHNRSQLARIDAAIKKEETRHERRMNALEVKYARVSRR